MIKALILENITPKKVSYQPLRSWCVRLCQSLTIGRNSQSDAEIPDDRFLSAMHFELALVPNGGIIRDLNSSNGTYVNGLKVNIASLNDGDQITAGATNFVVRFLS